MHFIKSAAGSNTMVWRVHRDYFLEFVVMYNIGYVLIWDKNVDEALSWAFSCFSMNLFFFSSIKRNTGYTHRFMVYIVQIFLV